jgi:hypothetical protein
VSAAAIEPVRTPESAGWLTPEQASALLAEMFDGTTVSPRTIQAWCRDPRRPLRHARLGHRLLVHRADLLARVLGGGDGDHEQPNRED